MERDVVYVVRKGFTDFYGNVFSTGETLTFVERNFLPYDGGHTIVFKERKLYLQEEENVAIIDSFAEYVSRAEDSRKLSA
jgi:hypothetical protein